jgi:hypothetical protein
LIDKFLRWQAKSTTHLPQLEMAWGDPVKTAVNHLGTDEAVSGPKIEEEIVGFTTMSQGTLEAALKVRAEQRRSQHDQGIKC